MMLVIQKAFLGLFDPLEAFKLHEKNPSYPGV